MGVEKFARGVIATGWNMYPARQARSVIAPFLTGSGERIIAVHDELQRKNDEHTLHVLGSLVLWASKQAHRPDLDPQPYTDAFLDFYSTTPVKLEEAMDPHAAHVIEHMLFKEPDEPSAPSED